MTDPEADGADTPRTRAERRAERSRAARRRARKNARRKREKTLRPTSEEETSEEATSEEQPTSEVAAADVDPVAVVPPPAPPEPEPEPEPEPDPAPVDADLDRHGDDEVEPEARLSRRERQQQKRRRARKHRARPPRAAPAVTAVAETAIPPGPEPEPAPAPEAEAPPQVAETVIPPEPAEPAVRPTARDRSPRKPTRPPSTRRPSPRKPTRPSSTRPPGDRAERRVFWTRTMPIIAGVLALAVVVGIVVRSVDDPTKAASPPRPASGPAEPDTLLMVHQSPLFGNDLIAIVGRDGDRGSVLLIPSATQLDVPSLGVATLGQVPVDDGGERIANSVENVVGVKVGTTVVLDDAALTAMLGPAAPMTVNLTAPVDLVDREVKYSEGVQEVSAAQATELLSGPQSVDELDRLVAASSVFDAWLTRLEDPAIGEKTRAEQADLAALVDAGQAPEHRIDTLGVESIATGGGERFVVREPDLADYVERAFPNARLGEAGKRPRVEILNGTGALGVAQAVADKVVPAGGKVTLTGNYPGFGLPTTQVVYYRDEWRDAAQRMVDAMGCGSLRKATKDVGIADATILVGFDCPEYGTPGGGN